MTSPLPGHPEFGRTGIPPRATTPDCLWTGRRLASSVAEKRAHHALHLLKGSAKTVPIDTGHPSH